MCNNLLLEAIIQTHLIRKWFHIIEQWLNMINNTSTENSIPGRIVTIQSHVRITPQRMQWGAMSRLEYLRDNQIMHVQLALCAHETMQRKFVGDRPLLLFSDFLGVEYQNNNFTCVGTKTYFRALVWSNYQKCIFL